MKENNDFLNKIHKKYVITVNCLLYEPMFIKLKTYKGLYKRCLITSTDEHKTMFFIEFINGYTLAEIKQIFSFGHIEVFAQTLSQIAENTKGSQIGSKVVVYGSQSYTNMLSNLTETDCELLVKVFDDTGVKYKIFDLEKPENGGVFNGYKSN